MTIPNLAGVITKADVDTKGNGSYAASYINWAKVAHLLHEHAKGWEFHLKPSPEGGLIWAAPDNTAYVIGYFSGPEGQATADFPFPAMDNRNSPISLDRVNARTLTDTHRRALCAAAAFTFGLAYELWAKEEVEDPHRETAAVPAKAVKKTATPTQKAAPAAKPKDAPSPAAPADPPLTDEAKEEIVAAIRSLKQSDAEGFDRFTAAFKEKYPFAGNFSPHHIQSVAQGEFCQAFFQQLTAS